MSTEMGANSKAEHQVVTSAQKCFLLSIPMELRLMILEQVLNESNQDCCQSLHFGNRGWCPPPILRTCHQLRLEGLPEWGSMKGSFDCQNLSAADMIARDRWASEIEKYYHINITTRTGQSIWVTNPTDNEAAIVNLRSWLQHFHSSGRDGMFLESDIDEKFVFAFENAPWYPVPGSFDPTILVWSVCTPLSCKALY